MFRYLCFCCVSGALGVCLRVDDACVCVGLLLCLDNIIVLVLFLLISVWIDCWCIVCWSVGLA